MKAAASGKIHDRKRAPIGRRHSAGLRERHGRDVPIVDFDDEWELDPDVSAIDALGADLCHRIVRDLADGGRSESAEADGSDPNDWLQSEADGAHLLQPTWRR